MKAPDSYKCWIRRAMHLVVTHLYQLLRVLYFPPQLTDYLHPSLFHLSSFLPMFAWTEGHESEISNLICYGLSTIEPYQTILCPRLIRYIGLTAILNDTKSMLQLALSPHHYLVSHFRY
jgi:hypothetical protein